MASNGTHAILPVATQFSASSLTAVSSAPTSTGANAVSVSSEQDANHDSTPPLSDQGIIIEHPYEVDWSVYRDFSSLATTDGTYFVVDWGQGGIEAYNPSFVPHPSNHDQWIVVAQQSLSDEDLKAHRSAQLACSASFVDSSLVCLEPPIKLPIRHTLPCENNDKRGPHDARVFYGPDMPYILYGSDSAFSCLGMWLHDARTLLPDFDNLTRMDNPFGEPVDVQKPTPPYGETEKNYFVFWDLERKPYVHTDLMGGRHEEGVRQFAPLNADGSVGSDLAPAVAKADSLCMTNYMPRMGIRNDPDAGFIRYEAIHQASNSLSITLCKKSDLECMSKPNNTFIMVVFHHKTFYSWHAEYHPYIMLFQQSAPFAIHAISQKGIWMHGRTTLTNTTDAKEWRGRDDLPVAHSEMFFVTNLSWKKHGLMYHGYLDDEVFLGFGIEDTRAGGIDVLAGDLLQDLAYCFEADI
ncbi:hypothetical protein EDD37DRAFT_596863 [Exophiala viscosa]|uniref:uncharacterized protein n=1 Tax=Exophiala viscosa TaxID=2486360 RepID=UPI00219EA617|nr:hypothetical protein EDD37DRAFT_596863 [Exophiala viscosa]